MAYYITFDDFQNHLKNHYLRTGTKLQLPKLVTFLRDNAIFKEQMTFYSLSSSSLNENTEKDLDQLLKKNILIFSSNLELSLDSNRNNKILDIQDVFITYQPRYTQLYLHQHNYFEINYVAQGSCDFYFQREMRSLSEGEFCIIPPNSSHDLVLDDNAEVISILIRKEVFDKNFFSLLSQKDLLAFFFRSILQENKESYYLLFFVDNKKEIKNILTHIIIECYKQDSYSNICCINWINLLFASLLRNYSQSLQFYNYQIGSDFSLILQHIQHNYKTISLSTLADYFHYSEQHLYTLIKQNTGHNFTELIKHLRLSDAVHLLKNTNLKISEISSSVGYNSADHFSRVFRQTYRISPQEFRKNHLSMAENFLPFDI